MDARIKSGHDDMREHSLNDTPLKPLPRAVATFQAALHNPPVVEHAP